MTDSPPTDSDQPTLQRLPDGRFAPGSGGRPRGAKNKVSLQAIAKIRELTDDAFRALKENVAANDMRAVQYVLDRIVPSGRFVELESASSGAVADALVNGELTPDEAKALTTALSKLKEMEDMDAIKDRMSEIERLLKG